MKGAISLLFFLYANIAFAQNPVSVSVPAISRPPTYLRDIFSTPFESKPYAGVQGSPFLEDSWQLAQIKVAGRKEVIDSLPIKLNVYDNRIHFKNEAGEEMQMTMQVEGIKIIDTNSAWRNAIFLTGFDQEKGFFEVVENGGKFNMLKKYSVAIQETKPLGSEPLRKFEPLEELFFSSGRILYKSNKSCLFVRDAFENNEKIFDYISANDIRCNKEKDMRKLVRFVASLK